MWHAHEFLFWLRVFFWPVRLCPSVTAPEGNPILLLLVGSYVWPNPNPPSPVGEARFVHRNNLSWLGVDTRSHDIYIWLIFGCILVQKIPTNVRGRRIVRWKSRGRCGAGSSARRHFSIPAQATATSWSILSREWSRSVLEVSPPVKVWPRILLFFFSFCVCWANWSCLTSDMRPFPKKG
jgi:hypothetical protein